MDNISKFLKKKFKISEGKNQEDNQSREYVRKILINQRKKKITLSSENDNNSISTLAEYVPFAYSTVKSDNFISIHQINASTSHANDQNQSRSSYSYQTCSKLSPILNSCSASIILNLSSSSDVSFKSESEVQQKIGTEYLKQEDEDFDFEAKNKILELIKKYSSCTGVEFQTNDLKSRLESGKDNNTLLDGKVYTFMIPAEGLKNTIMNYCSRKLFQIIPTSFNDFKSITCLQLCCNSLTDLPEEICLLKQLEILNLSNNRLKSIPSTIGYLKNLEKIFLDRNQLKTLPYSMNGLKKLRVISIAANEFETIPKPLMSLTRLVTLECDRNPNLLCVPAEIVRFSQISRFHLEECPKLLKESEFKSFEKDRTTTDTLPSLLECSARSLIRNKCPVLYSLPKHLRLLLSRAEECSFCSGPMIDFKVIRCRTIKRMERIIPIVDELCSAHWTDEKERIQTIFSKYPKTTPSNLISSDRRSRKGPTAPFNQFDAEKRARGRRILKKISNAAADIGQVLVPLSVIVDWPEYPLS